MTINTYCTEGGKDLILDYIKALPIHERADIEVALTKLEEDGLLALNILNTRQLYKKLWEIKISKNRLMYVLVDQNNMYILHACRKQKGKAEKHELETAKRRAVELGNELNKKFV